MGLEKLTIFERLTIGYVAMMVLVLFLGAYATLKLNRINRITLNIDRIDDATIRMAEQLSDRLFSQIGFGKKFLVSADRDFYLQFKENEKVIKKDISKLSELLDTPQKIVIFGEIENLYYQFTAMFDEAINRLRREEGTQGRMRQIEWDKAADRINIKLRALIQISRSERNRKLSESGRISEQVLKVTGITAGLIILMGIVISYVNTRSIDRPVLLLQNKTKEIAKGRFGEISNISSPPEIKELADHFNIMCRRLKELEEMKVDFISHVSHELRTPLTAIKEASSMLLEGVYAGNAEKEHDLLMITQEECERLIDSVNRILDLSRMEARMMTFHFKECRLEPLIRKAVGMLDPIARNKRIRVDLELSRNLPAVHIDEIRVQQVFENIIGNALKFASENDALTISASFQSEGEKFVQVAVTDTGPGIPVKDLGKIFDKFQRIENSIETVRGTGLGLSIAKHIISSHKGRIWVESREGAGSTFYFTLPVLSA